jgi:carboxylesterase type B
LQDNNRDNTFVYLFSHKGFISVSEVLNGGEKFYGTCHADDEFYFFPPPKDVENYFSAIPSKQDEKVRKNWIKLWVNFAKTGHPTPEWSSESKFPFWTPATKFPLDYMQIGNENGKSKELFQMKKDLYPERLKFWSDLKEQYNLKVWKTESKPKIDSKDEL